MSEEKCKQCKYYSRGKCDFILDVRMDGVPISFLERCRKEQKKSWWWL